jgi:hypothetical protein
MDAVSDEGREKIERRLPRGEFACVHKWVVQALEPGGAHPPRIRVVQADAKLRLKILGADETIAGTRVSERSGSDLGDIPWLEC